MSLTSAAWKTARKLQDDFKMGTIGIGYEKGGKNELRRSCRVQFQALEL
jgi:hypothetical protein